MSETAEPIEVAAVPTPPPLVQRASAADINEMGVWLFPRIGEHWTTTPHHVRGWLAGALPSNEQALIRCGDAIGMAHVEPGRLGHGARVVVDFVLSERLAEGQDEMEQIFRWFQRWARTLQAVGLFGVDDFVDIDRSFIRSWIGRLTKRESLAAMF